MGRAVLPYRQRKNFQAEHVHGAVSAHGVLGGGTAGDRR